MVINVYHFEMSKRIYIMRLFITLKAIGYHKAPLIPMNLLNQMKFYSVRFNDVVDASGFSQSYVSQVLKGERYNQQITALAELALHNRKDELLAALLKESA